MNSWMHEKDIEIWGNLVIKFWIREIKYLIYYSTRG